MFDKRKSNVAKGLAILILMVHHVFYKYARGGDFPDMKFLFPRLTYHVANYGAFVIFIFAAISGYGIAAYMSKKDSQIMKCIVRREIGLLETFIPVYLFAVALCFVFRGSFAFMHGIYGETKREVIVGSFFDMLGLANVVSTPQLNSTWWYMGAAHLIIVFIPILLKLASVVGSKSAVLCALILLVGRYQNATGTALRACVLAAFIGAYMYENKVIERVDAFFKKMRYGRVLEFFLGGLAIWVVPWIKDSGLLVGYYVWSLTVPFLLCLVNDFIAKIKGVSFILEKLGEYSSMIFMLHSFAVSIIPPLKEIVFSFDYAWKAYSFVLVWSISVSILLKLVLKLIGYDKLVLKVKERLLK